LFDTRNLACNAAVLTSTTESELYEKLLVTNIETVHRSTK